MKTNTSFAVILAVFLGMNIANACHIPPNPPLCPGCPPGSSLVSVDFDDFLAGTLVGGYSHLQHYSSANNVNLDAGLGFSIDVGNNKGPVVSCNEVEVGALYDTDRRQYLDESTSNTSDLTTDYEKTSVDSRIDQYVAKAARGEDSDLETTGYYNNGNEYSKWAGGNMEDYNLGNALIIQENIDYNDVREGHLDLVQGQDTSSTTHAPDDDYDGGFITFEFESAMSGFGFTFADMDIGEIEHSNITFFDTSGTSVDVSFAQFSNGLFQDRGTSNTTGDVVWGNNTANRIDTISVSELNDVMQTSLTNIGKVKFNFRSGGITHINYCYNAVPEPSTYFAGAGLLAIVGFHFFRNRKKIK